MQIAKITLNNHLPENQQVFILFLAGEQSIHLCNHNKWAQLIGVRLFFNEPQTLKVSAQ
jgi:hypothetical protein